MEHIVEEYGKKCNLLELTSDEYRILEPFLLSLGVRTRVTKWDSKKIVIQAENVFNSCWISQIAREIAEEQLTPFSISCYKR